MASLTSYAGGSISSAKLSEERAEDMEREIEELKGQYIEIVGDDSQIKELEEDPESFLEHKSKHLQKVARLIVELQEDQAKAAAASEKAPNDVQELYKIRYEKALALKRQAGRSLKERAKACVDALGKDDFDVKKSEMLEGSDGPKAYLESESKPLKASSWYWKSKFGSLISPPIRWCENVAS